MHDKKGVKRSYLGDVNEGNAHDDKAKNIALFNVDLQQTYLLVQSLNIHPKLRGI